MEHQDVGAPSAGTALPVTRREVIVGADAQDPRHLDEAFADIAEPGIVFADKTVDEHGQTHMIVRPSRPGDIVIRKPRRSANGRVTPAIVRSRPITVSRMTPRPARRTRSGSRRRKPAVAVARSGDPPRSDDGERPRGSRRRADFYEHPDLGYARRSSGDGFRPLYVVAAFTSRPSAAVDAERREQLSRPPASSEFRVCSIGGEHVHVSDLASNGAAGVRSWCKRHEAERRRENRQRRVL